MFRPRLDDPRRLENGRLHPQYLQWIRQHDFRASRAFVDCFIDHAANLLTDHDYFDRKKAIRLLGAATVNNIFHHDRPMMAKRKLPLVAEVLGMPLEELTSAYDTEAAERDKEAFMISMCRMHPARLMSYEEAKAGLPCPGCGVPWTGDRSADENERYRRDHPDCGFAGHSWGGGPQHCQRCCGFPPLSPEQRAKIDELIKLPVIPGLRKLSPEEEKAAKRQRRTERISELERTLVRLRRQEEEDRE